MQTLGSGFTGTDRFEVSKLLGEGGFGAVYEVYDRERKERVALKTLQRLEADALYRFKKEFRLLADASSPFLVSLHELFAEGDLWYFTMELVRGTDFLSYVLNQDLATEPTESVDEQGKTISSAAELAGTTPFVDVPKLRWALAELARAVQALHTLGMLHRDLKPGNVLVSESREVKLLDFGLLTEAGVQTSMANEVVGTVAYMAPEQASASPLTQAADWYSVGVMVYEALTSRWPHSGRPLEVLVAKQQTDPTPPVELVPAAPRDLSDLTMRLLERDVERRAGADAIFELLGEEEPLDVTSSMQPSMCLDEEGVFVGRELELEKLNSCLDSVARGGPVVAEVRGRSGMGKTALVEQFLRRIPGERGAVVLSGRCYEQESVPFKALDSVIDALCGYLGSLTAVAATALLPRDVSALSRLFPVLERVDVIRRAPAVESKFPDLQELRQRAVSALGELLSRICDRQILAIVIDDLQWGDLDSAVLLGQLLTAADPPGMLLLLSYRAEERDRSPFLRELLDRTALRAESRTIDVEALPEEAALELAAALLSESGGDAQPASIVAESERNPFFIHTLTHHATEATEATVEGVVSSFVAALPQSVRRLLEIVAVSGRPLSTSIAISAARAGAEGWKGLDSLRVARLIKACGGEGDLIECYHDRVREAVESELGEEELRSCHGALASALEAVGDVDPERLAHHFAGAGERGEAARQAIRAAESAAKKLAFDRAARLFRQAIELGQYDAEEERALRVKLADALSNAGLGGEAAPEYITAAEGMERVAALELRRRAAFQLLATGRFDEGCDILESVLNELGMKLTKTNYGALLSIAWQRVLLRLIGDREKLSVERGSEATAEDELVMDTCWAVSMGFRATQPRYVGGSTAKFVRLALAAGDPLRASFGLSMLATEMVVIRSSSKAVREQAAKLLDEARVLAEQVGEPLPIALNHHASGLTAFYLGSWQESLECFQLAVSQLRERCAGVTQDIANAEMHVVSSLFYLGRIRELSRHVPRLVQEARARGDIFASILYSGGYGFMAWLSKDDVETTRRELALASKEWPVKGFLLQNYMLLLAEQLTDLYCGNGLSAWDRLSAGWREIEKSPYFFMPMQRAKWLHISGAAAVAAAFESRARGESFHRHLRVGDRYGKRLVRDAFPSAPPHGSLVRAGVAMMREDRDVALEHLGRAEERFLSLDMSMHGTVASRCRGVVLGDDEGRALIEAADAVLLAQEIVRPERVAAMICPGFPSEPKP